MIHEVSKLSEDLSFFEGLALVVREAQEKDPQLKVQAEIIRRAHKHLREEIEQARREKDHFKEAVLELIRPLGRDTLSRVLSGKDTISYWTLYQIKLGLNLDQKTFEWLDSLRRLEEPRNHSTTQQRMIVIGGAKPSQGKDHELPPWINEYSPS